MSAKTPTITTKATVEPLGEGRTRLTLDHGDGVEGTLSVEAERVGDRVNLVFEGEGGGAKVTIHGIAPVADVLQLAAKLIIATGAGATIVTSKGKTLAAKPRKR
jgi:hypothetical protein